MDENLSQSVKIVISKQIAHAAIFYLKLLEQFFLIMWKNILWVDLQTFLVETIPHYAFDQEGKIKNLGLISLLDTCTNSLVDSLPYTICHVYDHKYDRSTYEETETELTVQSSAMGFWTFTFSNWL